MTENNNRVCCLYRVSTDKQVDFNSNHEADLPMQRKACHKFAESKGWVIVHEEQEEGVSGHKVRAAARDKLQIIKDYARKGKFDILLVFMFDRIGRIADETPFIVEWFVRNGIRVWSTQEGEQRFDNHTDKLLNYIRFWQADGESEKTSIRTKTALGQLVEDGGFKGGLAPYGYDLVKSGRFNKRKHEVYELVVNEAEAAVVRIIFDKYVHEGYGAQRIATYLNKLGYRQGRVRCGTTPASGVSSATSPIPAYSAAAIADPKCCCTCRLSRRNSLRPHSISALPVPILPNRSAVFLSTPEASPCWPGMCLWSLWLPALTHHKRQRLIPARTIQTAL